ncbi:hypothetical protein MBLNU457_1215t1 [Dothideomycetes sp. NU457]
MAVGFPSLPVEINQKIAENIVSDYDVASFRLICHNTNDALNGDRKSFWRRRFLDQFDKPAIPPNKSIAQINEHIHEKYKSRCRILARRTDFRHLGNSRHERKCLEVLTELLIEAYSGSTTKHGGEVISNNMSKINRFLDASDLLPQAFNPLLHSQSKKGPTRAYCAFLLVFTHRILGDAVSASGHRVFQFEECRRMAYASTMERPMFRGFGPLQINMGWLLHVANFWKYHLTVESECTMFGAFASLSEDCRPKAWDRQLKRGVQKLGRYWCGVYAHVESRELRNIRLGKRDGQLVIDRLNDEYGVENKLQIFEMDFPEPEHGDFVWEQQYDRVLHSKRPPIYDAPRRRTRSQENGSAISDAELPKESALPFTFCSTDPDVWYESKGWLNGLPTQEGIPGWQRITFMRYHVDHPDTVYWAYEGVVLPGNQIMMGRWWDPRPHQAGVNQLSGPFLYWNIDAAMMPNMDIAPSI